MRERLLKFLWKSSVDEKTRAQIAADFPKVVEKSGLTKKVKKALLARSIQKVRKLLGGKARGTQGFGNAQIQHIGLFLQQFTGPHCRLIDPDIKRKKKGKLTIVGTGIAISHVTMQAKLAIRDADRVYYCVSDPLAEKLIHRINNDARSLHGLYSSKKTRTQTYHEMIEVVLKSVRSGKKVCAVFYGHPGIYAYPTHASLRMAWNEGFDAKMCPGISALDCLFADLSIDPSNEGCQMLEATDLVIRNRSLDTSMTVILWQVGFVGELSTSCANKGLPLLVEKLCDSYGSNYPVVIYEASEYPVCCPRIELVSVAELLTAKLTGFSTLVLMAKNRDEICEDIVERMDLELD